MMASYRLSIDSPIEYIKGIGPHKGAALRSQLNICTVRDLLYYFPFRYVDKTMVTPIAEARTEGSWVQIKARIVGIVERGLGQSKRMHVTVEDDSGSMELIWFRSFDWVRKQLQSKDEYLFYGKLYYTNRRATIAHPEIEKVQEGVDKYRYDPIYSTTEVLQSKGIDTKGLRRLINYVLTHIDCQEIRETLPQYILGKLKLSPLQEALFHIHFPRTQSELNQAKNRFKFEELFFMQLRMIQARQWRKQSNKGYVFTQLGEYFSAFYPGKIPFELTNAQKRVIREIHQDMRSGFQMNRLLQGDVGSGKTIVAFMSMLIAIGNGYQCCLMAPTEILANQHYQYLAEAANSIGLKVCLLTSAIKGKERETLLQQLRAGEVHILIGTHAVLEDQVIFKKLGFCVIDEQHRFGVEQRAKLWKKAELCAPHVLVMTATPIPRTLAMSLYGDLDLSVIDELPPDRKPIKTLHFVEAFRGKLHEFMKNQIAKGCQVYIVYPIIEESAKVDLENLELGYEKLLTFFPIGPYQISVVHGRLKPADREAEMQRFVEGRSQIMVATTVIEVGVNVPNATVMVIENAERFGLSQLHQLRGRVGRGAEQSYCVLMTNNSLNPDAKARIKVLCETNDGFKIAEADLKLRGPGDLEGTRQSGLLDLKIADLREDGAILRTARQLAEVIIKKDPELKHHLNQPLKSYIDKWYDQNPMFRIS